MLRDIRDPAILGETLLKRKKHSKAKLSYVADAHDLWKIPKYSGEMLGFYTASKYRAELEAREDKYAQSTLERIDNVSS